MIAERWREPEAGIWELEPQRWTHSTLTCAAGLRAIAEQAPHGAPADRWCDLAGTLIDAGAVHGCGRWQRAVGDARVRRGAAAPRAPLAARPARPACRRDAARGPGRDG